MKSILVADADGSLVADLKNCLNSSEFEIHWAQDGQEALRQLRKNGPHLLVLDLFLGKVHGYALLRRLAARRKKPRVLILVVTSKAFPQDMLMARQLGAGGYLVKPVPADQLCKEVKHLLDSNSS